MNTLVVPTPLRSFPVIFTQEYSFLDELLLLNNYIVIVGEVIYALYKTMFDKFEKENLIVIKLDEERKTLKTAEKIYDILLKKTAKKNITIISFGGGINQDVVGFVASTIYRGVNWIYIPTTLLGMADSSIGLKTSLNFGSYKNMIGTFYSPSIVYIDPGFLATLKELDYASGIGEIIKLLLMKQGSLQEITKIEKYITNLKEKENDKEIIKVIKRALQVKLSYMKNDEFDQGRRNLLNYGHELGHALESASHFAIPHGVAVIIGMIFANLVSMNRGWTTKEIVDELNKKLFLPNIPSRERLLKKEYFDSSIIIDRLKKDKKRISKDLVLVLPDKEFSLVKITDLTIAETDKNITQLRQILL